MREGSHPNSRWDPLVDAARTDAARGMPRFSGALHARLMKAVRSAPQSPHAGESLSFKPFAIAAVLLVAGALAARVYLASPRNVAIGPSSTATPRPRIIVLNTPPLRATLASWGRQESALEADLGPTQLAGLDHDARLAAQYVLDPLSFPSRHR